MTDTPQCTCEGGHTDNPELHLTTESVPRVMLWITAEEVNASHPLVDVCTNDMSVFSWLN